MELHRSRLLGFRLLTDNKRVAEIMDSLMDSEGDRESITPDTLDDEFPTLRRAVAQASFQLAERNLKAETVIHVDNKVQAVTSADFGPQASNWVSISSLFMTVPPAGLVEAVAAACHQQNRAWCIAHGDDSQANWLDAPDWARDSAIAGVKGALAGNTPEQSHEGWLEQKVADGWVYGEVKDAEQKTHPCMVPYSDLPMEQKRKDEFFIAMVQLVGRVLGLS